MDGAALGFNDTDGCEVGDSVGRVDELGDVLGVPVGGSVGLSLGSMEGCVVSVGVVDGGLLG